jgi:hypothetical protein
MTANRYLLIGKFLPQISFSRICMNIPVADSINSSDLCIYDATGNLVVNAGPQKMGISGTECFKPVQSTPIVLPAGLYFYGATSAGSTLNISASAAGNQLAYSLSTGYGTSVGGACGSAITPPAESPTPAGSEFGLF